jgi:hypothetical protein
MIQLYAFVRGLRALPEPEELELLPLGALAAVVGPALGDEREDVLRHGLVVQELLDSADAVLPARFGERFEDTAALVRAVVLRTSELERRLAEVAGCVELTVRVARDHDSAAPVATDGGAYMRSRLRAVTADIAAADALHGFLRSRARDAVVSDGAASTLLHDACYLVERGRVEEFAQSVESYAAAHPELRLVCTGPWAPASFAGAA